MNENPTQAKADPPGDNQKPAAKKIVTPDKNQLLAEMRQSRREPFDIETEGCIYRVWVHAVTALQFAQWGRTVQQDGDGRLDDDYANARFVQMCVRDDKGHPYFTPDDVTLLIEARCHIAIPLIDKCNEVNGLNLKGRRAIAKNSVPMPGVGS